MSTDVNLTDVPVTACYGTANGLIALILGFSRQYGEPIMATVSIKNVYKKYGDTQVLNDIC